MEDVLVLARLQFAITAIAHYLFVALTLGLVTYLVVMQTRWAATGKETHRRQTRFWGQLYVINYAMGIGTGIVMEFQFGLTWSGLTHFVGNVFGAPLAIETLVAFFAESTLLGLWIFGWNRMGRTLHTVLLWLVALTAYASVFFVLTANGFLNHPVGYETKDGTVRLTDFTALLTNPNALSASAHILAAAVVTGSFFIIAVSAWHLRRRTGHDEFFWSSMKLALPAAPVLVLATAALGGWQIDNSVRQTPTKYGERSERAQALVETFTEKFGPGNYFPPGFSQTAEFVMIIPALFMMLIAVIGGLFMIRRNLIRRKVLLWLLTAALVLPYVSNVSGWIFREVGRQPWAVYGVLKTEDAVTPGLGFGTVLTSLLVFGALVIGLLVVDWALLLRFARRGPDGSHLGRAPGEKSEDTLADLPRQAGDPVPAASSPPTF
ncbi:cytochrome ubiquinol oxidase subunit I [Streptomyces sp. NEAU-W12]|uniref:cytochrome ubiquinol oxidase subunit I n=1 Tax=Streptomyces sp. NEAU-W12 TaxID=2994668 RepID=UPI00224B4E5B|nr:cytochrome ubiquinol oxidase subunit I [Streptomyces sp. NEAU-W12]MCX2923052.1 cytochrome ubiquinol oxidase subunit I [Streptomyces sp. NEAU-W12]